MQRFDSTGVIMYIIDLLMQEAIAASIAARPPNFWRTTHDTKPPRAILGAFCISTRHHIL